MTQTTLQTTSRSLIRNASLGLFGTVSVLGMSLLTSVIIAVQLGPSLLGLYSLVQWTRMTVGLLLDVGLTSAMTKFVSEFEGRSEPALAHAIARMLLGVQALVAVPVGLGLALGASLVAQLLGQPSITGYLRIAAIVLMLSMINGLLRAQLSGFQRFGQRAVLDIGASCVTLIGTLVVLANAWSILGLLWLEVVVVGMQFVVFSCLLLRTNTHHVVQPVARPITRRMARYCTGVFCVTTIDAIVWQRSETFFLGRYSAPSEIAYYGLAYNISTLVFITLSATLGGVLFPTLSRRFGANQHTELQSIYAAATKYLALMMLPLAVGGIALAPGIIDLLYGAEYQAAVPILRMLLLGASLGGLIAPGSALLFALGRPSRVLVWGVPIAALNIALAFLLVPRFGGWGAATANSVSQIASVSATTLYVVAWHKYRLPWRELMRVALAALVVGGFAWLVATQLHGVPGLLVAILLGVLVYGPVLVMVGALTPTDMAVLDELSRRGPRMLGVFMRLIIRMRPAHHEPINNHG